MTRSCFSPGNGTNTEAGVRRSATEKEGSAGGKMPLVTKGVHAVQMTDAGMCTYFSVPSCYKNLL